MKFNMGYTDSLLRVFVVAMLYVLVFTGVITGVLKLVVGIVGFVLAVTAFFGFCPLYHLFGLSTCSVKESDID